MDNFGQHGIAELSYFLGLHSKKRLKEIKANIVDRVSSTIFD